METSKVVHIVHAEDTGEHLTLLTNTLSGLKNEGRISHIKFLPAGNLDTSVFSGVRPNDMIITLLSSGIEKYKATIEKQLLQLKNSRPGIYIAEILLDNVPYEPEFIAFPQSLQPIRSSEDPPQVWRQVGENLREIFPAPHKKDVPAAIPWKKYLPYIGGVLALLIVLMIVYWLQDGGDGEFRVTRVTAQSLATASSSGNPCPQDIEFEGIIAVNQPGVVTYNWSRSDGSKTEPLQLVFDAAGEQKVSDSWRVAENRKSFEGWGQLHVNSPAEISSNRALASVDCPTTDPGPTTDIPNITARAQVTGNRDKSGDCPQSIGFVGTIQSDRSTTVTYTWVRSDGAIGPQRTITLDQAGSVNVRTTWQLGAAGRNYRGYWQQLKIISPREVLSERAVFNLTCNSGLTLTLPDPVLTPMQLAELELFDLSPSSPRSLRKGTRVSFKFRYKVNAPGGVRIFGRPMFNGQLATGYGAHGSQVLETGNGTGSGYFTLTVPGRVDQIRLRMVNGSDPERVLREILVPVRYSFTN